MNIKPMYDRIVVKRLDAEQVSAGGIIIPGTATEKPQEGEILAVGPGRVMKNGSLEPLDLKVGEKVMFNKYAGSDIKVGDDELLIMREDDVLAVVE